MVLKYVGSRLRPSTFIVLVCATAVTAMPMLNRPLHDDPQECERRRDLLKTLWSCIVTIVALSADYYGVFVHTLQWKLRPPGEVFSTLLYIFSVPLLHPSNLVRRAVQAWVVPRRLLRKGIHISPHTCKVVIASNVYVDMAENDRGGFVDAHAFGEVTKLDSGDRRLKEAVELPCLEWNRTEACSQIPKDRELIELNLAGKEWLLQSGLLPPTEQFQFLQTTNAMAIGLSAIQAFGFLLSIVERFVQKLKVSPLEGVATPMAVVVLAQALFHRWAAGSCRRILIIHLKDDELPKWERGLSQHPFDYDDYENYLRVGITIFVGAFVLGPTVPFGLYFYKLHNKHGLDVSALTFQIAMATYILMLGTTRERDTRWSSKPSWARFWACITLILLAISFVFALIYTVMYWHIFDKEQKFLIRYVTPHV